MNVQVQKLEELLQRVQTNRNKPRVRSVAAAPIAAAPVAERAEPSKEFSPRPAAAVEEPFARPARPVAVEKPAARERISRPEPEPAARPAQPEPQPLPAAPEPARTARVTPGRPLRITPAGLTRAAGAVASVVSQHPESEEVTFGELLRRSLSLRPR
jgi:hypothetical protein